MRLATLDGIVPLTSLDEWLLLEQFPTPPPDTVSVRIGGQKAVSQTLGTLHRTAVREFDGRLIVLAGPSCRLAVVRCALFVYMDYSFWLWLWCQLATRRRWCRICIRVFFVHAWFRLPCFSVFCISDDAGLAPPALAPAAQLASVVWYRFGVRH